MKPLARYASLNRYVDLCRTVDVDAVALMRSVGLSPASLANPDQWVPAASIASLLERSAAESGHEDFGLLLAGLRRLSNLGPLSLVIREEPDVRSALDVLMRYEHTYNESLRIRLNEVNGLATLRISLEVGEPVDTRQSVELAVGATAADPAKFPGFSMASGQRGIHAQCPERHEHASANPRRDGGIRSRVHRYRFLRRRPGCG